MERKDFIEAIFSFFNVKDEEKSLFKAYDLALSSGKNIDWNKLYMRTLKEVNSRYLPAPKFFIEQFDACRKITYQSSKDDGNLVRVLYNDGRFTDFVICQYGLTVNQLKDKCPKNYNIKEIRMYPKQVKIEEEIVDVELIGSKVYPEGTPYEVLFARA